ncbi:hypothetical protein [Peribacillus simplex]|uniref:Uncharacterized protein n=1 Tax=Peribacillus simplex TaxID=1478 RepID=A0A9X8R855_9BACI|nr:hypothetical protein [Peribacillus simplex]WHY57704.1 hypothetical protein QNH43_05290 [Peribacillus simplex]SIQ97489.1 hypothetical protein SAMN05878482_102676 [Peribacillus simplex]
MAIVTETITSLFNIHGSGEGEKASTIKVFGVGTLTVLKGYSLSMILDLHLGHVTSL